MDNETIAELKHIHVSHTVGSRMRSLVLRSCAEHQKAMMPADLGRQLT